MTTKSSVTLLDGGMGREILRMGAPFGQPEWSALSLMKAPELVKKAHLSFVTAGSDILTTSNYAVVPFHIGKDRFLDDGPSLISLAGQLAKESGATKSLLIAGSIPPLFGSYRPDLFDASEASRLLPLIIEALSPFVDIWLGETISCIAEAKAISTAIKGDSRPLWLSFTLDDTLKSRNSMSQLRSGESVTDALRTALSCRASAILFNCSQPEAMVPAVNTVQTFLLKHDEKIDIGVYANGFPPTSKKVKANTTLASLREDLDPKGYLDFGSRWINSGATIIGGCCGIGPEHIAALKKLTI